jgi:hypothetical protein
VEFYKEWRNLYGTYYRVIKGDLHYDIKPKNMEEIKDAWIKTSDKLPEIGERVLVVADTGKIVISKLVDDTKFISVREDDDTNSTMGWEDDDSMGVVYSIESVTYWQPLPEKPE